MVGVGGCVGGYGLVGVGVSALTRILNFLAKVCHQAPLLDLQCHELMVPSCQYL